MPRHEEYTQCKLRRPSVKGHEIMTSWIPTPLAKKGLVVKLKDELGVWTEGWTVMSVGTTKKGKYVEAAVRDHLNQRSRSDV